MPAERLVRLIDRLGLVSDKTPASYLDVSDPGRCKILSELFAAAGVKQGVRDRSDDRS